MAKRHSHPYEVREALRPHLAIGLPRHRNRHDGLVHSLGTLRAYKCALLKVSKWLRNRFGVELVDLDEELSHLYLEERAAEVGQSAVNLDRQAMQVLVGPMEVVKAVDPSNALATRTRAYTADQVDLLSGFAPPRLLLPIRIGRESGPRGEELLTLRRREERPPSRRSWDPERFVLFGDYRLYTVHGKGGLVREIALSPEAARELEALRRPTPVTIKDRGIEIESYYSIPGGQALSQAFGELSYRVFGWSNGFHGLRHSYAQRRIAQMMEGGYCFARAREIGSQELGHFDPRSMNHYLR